MDIITKLKKILERLYSNKAFRIIFFLLFLLIVIYKYSNMKTGIETISSNPEVIDGINIPKKINVIKKAQDTFMTEVDVKNKEKEKREEKIKKLKEVERQKEEEQRIKDEKIAKLKDEFTSKTNKGSYVLKSGDIADVKMIITNGDDYSINMEPMNLPIKTNNDKNNIFGRRLMGKKVGQVVIIPFKDFLEDHEFQNTLNKVKNEQSISNSELNFDSLKDSQITYRIKIIGLSKEK